MTLEWREQLSVGNDLIDADHKYLIDIINLAEQGLKTHDCVMLTGALDNLSRYSIMHFSREETIAAAAGYPQASSLHESHGELMKMLVQLKKEIGDQWDAASATRFSAFLRAWLIDHVIKEDLLMKPFLKKHSPRFDPR